MSKPKAKSKDGRQASNQQHQQQHQQRRTSGTSAVSAAAAAASATSSLASATSAATVPAAPYPPMISPRYPSTQLSSIRSSLSTSPHYAAPPNAGMGAGANTTAMSSGGTGGGFSASGLVPASSDGSSLAHDELSASQRGVGVGVGAGAVFRTNANAAASMDSDSPLIKATSSSVSVSANAAALQPSRVMFSRNNDVLACININNNRDDRSISSGDTGGAGATGAMATAVGASLSAFSYSSDDEHNPTTAGSAGTSGNTTPVKGNLGGKKLGPVLLELRRLFLSSDDANDNDEKNNMNSSKNKSRFTSVSLCLSRGNPSLGTSVSSTCLDVSGDAYLYQTSQNQSGSQRNNKSSDYYHFPSCATGLTTGALCIHSFHTSSSGTSSSSNMIPSSGNHNPEVSVITPTIEYYQATRNHRPATAVAWRPTGTTRNQVAIGLVGSSSGGNITSGSGISERTGGSGVGVGSGGGTAERTIVGGPAMGASRFGRASDGSSGGVLGSSVSNMVAPAVGGRAAAGDREYCCFVWDVEYQASSARRTKTTPLYKLSHQTGVAALGWLLEGGQVLAVGGQLRNLHLYDLRISGAQGVTPPVTVYAHNNGVHGIEVDPNRPWQFATYCRTADEPVKLWDARRMDSALSEIKVATAVQSSQAYNPSVFSSTSVQNVRWSTLEPGTISISVGDTVYDYETFTSGSRPVHTRTVYTKEPLLDFCLYPYSTSTEPETTLPAEKRLISELYPNRMVAIFPDRTVHDLPKHTLAPVAISRRDGRLAHAHGRTLWIGPTGKGPSSMESLQIHKDEDISATMMRRARCLHVAKYSMNTSSNIKMLAEDGILAVESPQDGLSPTRAALLRLWSWIDRVEELCSDIDEAWDDGLLFTSRGLVDAGAWQLLRMDFDDGNDKDVESFSEALACPTYGSSGRRATLSSCGWAGKYMLENVLGECEDLGEYERSAALAVWHGDIGAGVEALQRGADFIRGQLSNNKKIQDPWISSRYAETLELVSLCVAGYRGGDAESSTFRIWSKACSNLMQRNELSTSKSSRTAYLRGLMRFLLTIGFADGHQAVLGDESLSLCDRVAFACHFLTRIELKKFLAKNIDECERSGNVEGIVITGIEKKGIEILQSYVDRHADVQTAALITSRVIFPSDWTAERRISAEWLHSYRSLLNSWQMWQSRAMFDVDRADLLRKIKMKQNEGTVGGYQGRRIPSGRKAGLRQADPDILPAIPAQLDARCNYCSSPLGLKMQDSHANQWLSKMKPVLSCCPQCRKPLPRCAICMLSLGALNPYMELTKERSRPARGGTPLQPPDDLSSLANFPFAEWFTWCMRCKHGGHAHHLVGWFANHETCPVSGCDCRCQFDGIQKLNRPALSRSQNSEPEIQQNIQQERN